jgi:hypothetical protein
MHHNSKYKLYFSHQIPNITVIHYGNCMTANVSRNKWCSRDRSVGWLFHTLNPSTSRMTLQDFINFVWKIGVFIGGGCEGTVAHIGRWAYWESTPKYSWRTLQCSYVSWMKPRQIWVISKLKKKTFYPKLSHNKLDEMVKNTSHATVPLNYFQNYLILLEGSPRRVSGNWFSVRIWVSYRSPLT